MLPECLLCAFLQVLFTDGIPMGAVAASNQSAGRAAAVSSGSLLVDSRGSGRRRAARGGASGMDVSQLGHQ